MNHLALLGNALGSVVMYWGAGTLLVALWILAALLSLAMNEALRRITGKRREWCEGFFDSLQKLAGRLEFRQVGWLPGLVIEVWYAGYAATVVRSEASRGSVTLLHLTAVLGIAISGAVFGLLFYYFEGKKGRASFWIPAAVFTVSLIGYVAFLGSPEAATSLHGSWTRVLAAVLGAMIDSL